MFLCTQFPQTILKNTGIKNTTRPAAVEGIGTHASVHVDELHGSAQRSSTGKSSLHIMHINGGVSLKTPEIAESTAATAARPALAKRCSVLGAARASLALGERSWRSTVTDAGLIAEISEVGTEAAGALRVRRAPVVMKSSVPGVADAAISPAAASEMERASEEEWEGGRRVDDEVEVVRLKLSDAENARRGAAAVWAVTDTIASAT
jgi:hypothetical protein